MSKKPSRRLKPATVKDMARRRGLAISRAMAGGWYVTLISLPLSTSEAPSPTPVLYATHDWKKAREFVKKQPILISRHPGEDE